MINKKLISETDYNVINRENLYQDQNNINHIKVDFLSNKTNEVLGSDALCGTLDAKEIKQIKYDTHIYVNCQDCSNVLAILNNLKVD